MKIIYCALALACVTNIANAEIINEKLSQVHKQFEVHLQQGDTLLVQYNLERKPMTREKEWQYYALYCYSRGKAEMEYRENSVQKITKLPALMSAQEYEQDSIKTYMDSNGEFKISNLSEYYSGTVVNCALYPKFGE